MAIKKIISAKKEKPVLKAQKKVEIKEVRVEQKEEEQISSVPQQYESSTKIRSKRACVFCQGKYNPSYTDLSALRRFLTDRAKIVAKERSGVCAKHQRQVAKNIKYARHLALLPFVPKV